MCPEIKLHPCPSAHTAHLLKSARHGQCQVSVRQVKWSLFFMAALALVDVQAQSRYPDRAVRLVATAAAGGGVDAIGRLIGEQLSHRLKQPVVVDNKGGAGGNIASQHVANSPADGYTLLLTSNSHTLNPLIYKNAGYHAIKDFMPLIKLSDGPEVLVTAADSLFKTLKDVVDASKAKPRSLSYGSSGIGGPVHMAMELLMSSANIDVVHAPYKGTGPSLQDALGGQIPLVMASATAAMPLIQSGKLRPLVLTGAVRIPSLPQVPTVVELGYPAAVHTAWVGIFAPTGTPPAIVTLLNREIAAVLAMPEIAQRFKDLATLPVGGTEAEFRTMVNADQALHEKLVARLGLKAD